ncbi:hypothetical protein M436DRAFT_80663 [Aureobasidium namibiae CBS 147.97]|uniref:Uncharacterized protein n=1 Tax=Aureobasidium namibiae CBS 147.97 TaxID=1043004 RepID=A0A074WRL5_9PEZI
MGVITDLQHTANELRAQLLKIAQTVESCIFVSCTLEDADKIARSNCARGKKLRKRDDTNSTIYPGLTTDSSVGGLVLIDANGTNWYSPQVPVFPGISPAELQRKKRDASVAIPAGLAKYQSAVISAACSMQAKPVSSTSTLTQSATVTGAATTTVVSAVATVTKAAKTYDPSEFAVISIQGGTFSSDGTGYSDFLSDPSALFVNVRNSKTYGASSNKANIAVDPNTGYLVDVSRNRVATIYGYNAKDGAATIIFFHPEDIPGSYKPLICTPPPQAGGAYTLSCSVTQSNGLVLSNFIGPHNFFDGYSFLSMTAAADLDGTSFSTDYGKASITIINR